MSHDRLIFKDKIQIYCQAPIFGKALFRKELLNPVNCDMDKPTVTWILEINPEFTDPELLAGKVDNCVRIEGGNYHRREWPEVNGPVAVLGTFRCLQQMLKIPGLADAAFDTYSLLKCSSYYPYLFEYLKRESFFIPLSALPYLDLSRIFGDSVFIRPDANTKPFEAEVVKIAQLEEYLSRHQKYLTDLVALSEVIPIEREFRCFCRNGIVFADSSYLEDNYQPAPSEVITFAETVAAKTLKTLGINMLTVDVALSNGELKLIEIGGVNSWGFYGANLQDYIAGMEAEAKERYLDLAGL